MKSLFNPATAIELTERIERLRADSVRQWGKMTPAQAMAHCAGAMEWAVGDNNPPRMLIGRLLGGLIKGRVVKTEDVMARNTPTSPQLVIGDDRDLAAERARLQALIQRFSSAGVDGCTNHPHTFFGRLTPDEWAILMYKHVDHHLRQFGV